MLSLTFAILNISLLIHKKKILLFSTLYGLVPFLSAIFLQGEFRLITNISAFFLLIFITFRYSLFFSFVITLISLTSVGIAEIIVTTMIVNALTIDFKEILNNPIKRIGLAYVNFIPMILLTFLIKKSKWKFSYSKLSGKRMYLISLIIIGLTEIVLFVTFFMLFTAYNVTPSILGVPIHFVLILFFAVLSFWILHKLYKLETSKAIQSVENTYEEQLKSLLTSIRSERHDINNHLMVIHGLLKQKHPDSAEKYLKNLIGDIQINTVAIQLRNPVVSSLLYSKLSYAQQEGIDFKLEITDEEISNKLTMTDTIRLFSNLIDNAIEATLNLPKEERKILFKMTLEDQFHTVVTKNTSSMTEFKEDLFEIGISTKEKSGTNKRGFGLSIIKQVANKYEGTIHTQINNKEVTIQVQFPCREVPIDTTFSPTMGIRNGKFNRPN